MRAEITAGHLPAPSGDGLTTAYVVVMPPKDKVTMEGAASGEGFCAYHSGVPDGSASVIYAVLPDNGTFGTNSCGAHSGVENETSYLTHELAEMITDPMYWNNEVGWYDNSGAEGGEIGDLCATSSNGGGEATNTINGNSYVVQKEWSNQGGACESASTYKAPSADFTANVSGSGAIFTASASTTNGMIASYGWSFGDGVSGSGESVSHAYGSAGTYTVTLTVTDSMGFVGRVSHQVTISPPAGGGGSGGEEPPSKPPPPPAPPPPPVSPPLPEIVRTGAASVSQHGASIVLNLGSDVRCPQGSLPCLVSVRATADAASGPKHRPNAITIGSAGITAAPGAAQPLALKLSGQGRKLLRERKRLHAEVAITVHYGGQLVTGTRTIGIRLRRH